MTVNAHASVYNTSYAGTPKDSSLEEAIALSLNRESRLAESLKQDPASPQTAEPPEVGFKREKAINVLPKLDEHSSLFCCSVNFNSLGYR